MVWGAPGGQPLTLTTNTSAPIRHRLPDFFPRFSGGHRSPPAVNEADYRMTMNRETAERSTILRGLVGSTVHRLNVNDGIEDRDEMGVSEVEPIGVAPFTFGAALPTMFETVPKGPLLIARPWMREFLYLLHCWSLGVDDAFASCCRTTRCIGYERCC